LYGHANSAVYGFIAGLGGRDVTHEDICGMVQKAMKGEAADVGWWGLQD
jgi:pyruvate/2-oxoacid:ferredoxin oxidoreductase alpha subunit